MKGIGARKMKKNKTIKIDKILIAFGNRNLALTMDEIKELKAALDELVQANWPYLGNLSDAKGCPLKKCTF